MLLDVRTVIYARLSRRSDVNALNLDDQIVRCREYATRQGWTVVAERSDYGESAFERDAIEDRPGFGDVLTLVRDRQVDAVLAWRPDRLFRDPIEQALFFRECQRHGVATVATVAEGQRDPANPGDEMVGTIVAAVARYESNAKRARLLAKHRQLAEAGKVSGGGTRPFGFEDDRVTIRPDEADVIRWAAKEILAGTSLRTVCRMLTDRGVATVTGKPWTSTVLKGTLTRARIAGLREHRGTVTRAVWPAIVTPDDLAQLRATLLDPARATRHGRGRVYLLTGGVAVCGHCGAPLVARPKSGGRPAYHCARGVNFTGCGKISRLAIPVEDEVAARLFAAIDDGTLADAEPEPAPELDGVTLADIEARLTDLSRDHYVLRVISRAEFLAARDPLAAEADRLRARLSTPRGPRHPLHGLREVWPVLSMGERRQVVAEVIDRVVLLPALKGRNRFDPSRIEVVWRV